MYIDSAGDAVGVYSRFLKNRQAAREAEFDAAKSRMDAAYARLSAGEARRRGDADARMGGLKTGSEIGRVRANFGASGVDVNVGAPRALAADARMLGDYDAALIRHDAALKAFDREYDARVSSLSANLADARARMLKKTGILDAVSGGLNIGGGLPW